MWPMAPRLMKTEVLSSDAEPQRFEERGLSLLKHGKCPCFWPQALEEGAGPIIRVANPELT